MIALVLYEVSTPDGFNEGVEGVILQKPEENILVFMERCSTYCKNKNCREPYSPYYYWEEATEL